eukprot:5522235-Alexandrium_andersonii.AAC.1
MQSGAHLGSSLQNRPHRSPRSSGACSSDLEATQSGAREHRGIGARGHAIRSTTSEVPYHNPRRFRKHPNQQSE